MTGPAIPPDVSGHLVRFRDGLLAAIELRGLYLYRSLTTGDFSPATSDIDVFAVTSCRPVGAELDRLSALHLDLDLASGGGAYARLVLGDFGVPDWLADQIRRRRAGAAVFVSVRQRLIRAALSRHIMATGIRPSPPLPGGSASPCRKRRGRGRCPC